MTRVAIIAFSALAITGLGATMHFLGRAEAATYHVDFERGRDDSDGLSPSSAWRHAPGDPAATERPARTALRPGDQVVFAAGVRYRGSIVVSARGTAAQPVLFTSAQPGAAVIDGSDPVASVAPCRSAEECGGASEWRRLVKITPSQPFRQGHAPMVAGQTLREAQEPDPADGFYADEKQDMAEVDGLAMSAGRVALPNDIAAGLAPGERLALWVKPNRVVQRTIQRVEGNVAVFEPSGLQFYTDRPAAAAAVGAVSLIDEPGEYAALPGGDALVAMLPPEAKVSIATGRAGLILKGVSHVVVRGLAFENMSDGGAGPPAGVAIFADRDGARDLLIENNSFRNFMLPRGAGPIILRDAENIRIAGNTIESVSLGSGIRVSGRQFVIESNRIHRIGRTAIMLMNTSDALVRGNVISDVRGVHGNGLSAYLDNHDVRFVANTVTQAKQPATFHGAGPKASQPNRILFANNLFVATPDALGVLISWGKSASDVTIRNNVLLGGRTGLRLNARDTGLVITDNIASGLTVAGDVPSGWVIQGNEWTALSSQQRKRAGTSSPSNATLTAARDAMEGKTSSVLCAIITRNSGVARFDAERAQRAVGANMQCP